MWLDGFWVLTLSLISLVTLGRLLKFLCLSFPIYTRRQQCLFHGDVVKTVWIKLNEQVFVSIKIMTGLVPPNVCWIHYRNMRGAQSFDVGNRTSFTKTLKKKSHSPGRKWLNKKRNPRPPWPKASERSEVQDEKEKIWSFDVTSNLEHGDKQAIFLTFC